MTQNPASEEGCFQAAFPSYFWEKVQCKSTAHPNFRSVPRRVNQELEVTGNGNDFVAQAAGLISKAVGTFPTVTGVKTESSVGVALFGIMGTLLSERRLLLPLQGLVRRRGKGPSRHSLRGSFW